MIPPLSSSSLVNFSHSMYNKIIPHRAGQFFRRMIDKEEIPMIQEVYEFLKKCRTYYLATVDGDQARVRPFGTIAFLTAGSPSRPAGPKPSPAR